MTITRHVYIDFGMDGTFGHASADVTAYVESLQFGYGLNTVLDEIAQPSRMTLVMRNDAGDWWQDVSGRTFYDLLRPYMKVKLVYTVGVTDYTRYIGRLIPPVMYDANQYASQRRIMLNVGDLFTVIGAHDYAPKLRENVRVDEEIEAALSCGVLAEPYHEDVWVLGASALGTNTRFPDISGVIALDAANTALAHTGVDAGTETRNSLLSYLWGLASAELGGRLFYDAPTGKITFHNRQRDWLNRTSTATINNDDLIAATPLWGGTIVNRVTVNYALTEEGTPNIVLWSAPNLPLYVGPNSPKEFRIQYRDPDNEAVRVAALDVQPMVRDLDYAGNEAADGTGEGITDKLTATVSPDATGATVRISTGHNRGCYLTTLQVRGTPLKTLDGQQAVDADPQSVSANGVWPVTLDVPMINDADTAAGYAHWVSRLYSDATTRFQDITLTSAAGSTVTALIMTLDVGDRITVEEVWSGHDADYFIIGAQCSDSGQEVVATYRLKPASAANVWILGTSQLGIDTVLAY